MLDRKIDAVNTLLFCFFAVSACFGFLDNAELSGRSFAVFSAESSMFLYPIASYELYACSLPTKRLMDTWSLH